MEVNETTAVGGSLQISKDVIARIAKLATLEIEGVKEVAAPSAGVKSLFGKAAAQKLQRPILVELTEDVAEITVQVVVVYGYKVPQLCAKIQENVKSSVQNMTSITVSRVNIVVAGVSVERVDAAQAE